MPADNDENSLLHAVIQHFNRLLNDPVAPSLPPELAALEAVAPLHAQLLGLRENLTAIASGDLSTEVVYRGIIFGLLKRHVANLRHLTWQVEQVASEDFSQRIDFMGEFSTSFNRMVAQLHDTRQALTELAESLRSEISMRTMAVQALQESESRFRYLADHDSLTGALNRRSFLSLALRGIRAAHENTQPCCMAILDVDHFKRFNDTYGHVDGDTALKHVVRVCTQNLRDSDSMGRFGGEEMIFFFANVGLAVGHKVADRIRQAIADSPVVLACGPVTVTASMGLSVVLPEWEDLRNPAFVQKMISMADFALYQAKQAGRNRVCLAPELHPDVFSKQHVSICP
ncbi:diguanylate cyclase [Desulfosarcina sp. OttesenSCG-928-G10]|nr:diguanylate cyclase [Desulfosarcina sp. OttesenSCG-928-G10]MDL2320834.1 diguanylate cyclase [Desulfosarcina sp. OttesenSCG-928-B08]